MLGISQYHERVSPAKQVASFIVNGVIPSVFLTLASKPLNYSIIESIGYSTAVVVGSMLGARTKGAAAYIRERNYLTLAKEAVKNNIFIGTIAAVCADYFTGFISQGQYTPARNYWINIAIFSASTAIVSISSGIVAGALGSS